jgi:spoIIIJ-associated protein
VEWVETTGRTVEEAKDAALDQLGVDEQDAEFEIIEEPRSGLFGRLRSEARVRARVRPTRPRPKDERRDRRRRSGGGRTGGRDGGGREAPRRGGERGDRGDERPERPQRAAEPRRDRAPREESSAPSNGGAMNEDVPLDQQAEVAREFLEGLVDAFGVSATVTAGPVADDTVELAVQGDNLGLLIGPKGQTLTAIQELARTVVQRRTGGRNGRLLVDVAGYRQARREALERFTRQVADQVKESGQARALEPMHPADRKVVHDTVNDIDGVATTSEGEEPRRRVVIVPE